MPPRPVSPAKPLHYDLPRRRLWIFGQRCHHGAAGTLVAVVGLGTRSVVALAAGSVLMLHDWEDRSIWFQPGPGPQA